jgi:hypothetical protein
LSVRVTLVVAAIIPVALFMIGTAAVLYSVARTQLERGVHAKLDTIAAFLTQSARAGLEKHSAAAVRVSVLSALSDRDVVHISVYDRRGKVLAQGDRDHAAFPGGRHRRGPRQLALGAAGLRFARALPGQSRPTAVRIVIPKGAAWPVPASCWNRARGGAGGRVVVGIGLPAALANLLRGIHLLGATVTGWRGRPARGRPGSGASEMGELGRSFNAMTRQLSRVPETRRPPGRRSSRGRRTHDRLRPRAAGLARESVKGVSGQHEPRDPHPDDAVGLRGPVGRGGCSRQEAQRLLEIVRRNGGHLLDVLNDISTYRRSKSGRSSR